MHLPFFDYNNKMIQRKTSRTYESNSDFTEENVK